MGSGATKKKPNVAIERSTRNFNHHAVVGPFIDANAEQSNTISVRNKKLINIVWFDSRSVPQDDIIDTNITKKTLSTALQSAILTCFSERDPCVGFLRQNQDTAEVVFLIISGQDSTALFDALDSNLFRSIDSIFIFCLSKQRYESQLLYDKKVVGIYCEHVDLLESIQTQAVMVEQQDLILKYYISTQKTAHIVSSYAKGEFVWIRALKEAFLQIERTEKVMKQMYDRFRILYRRDVKELAKIDEFEKTYRPENAIQWYTKDSFLYRVVNQSLRTENTDELFMFSPYVADLCRAMRALQTKLDRTITFFRGCVLNKTVVDEFRSHIRSLLSINTFFSASRQRDVAESFASCGSLNGNTTIVSVLFEIEVKESTQSFFADIASLSLIKDEGEVLFDLNAVFTIHNVTYDDSDECWIIHLIADAETFAKNEQVYRELCEEFNLNTSSLVAIGVSLMMTGNTREAYRYASRLPLSNSLMSAYNLVYLSACIIECDYSRALGFLKRIYENCERSNSFEVHQGWTHAAVWIADILTALGEFRLASQYVESIIRYYRAIKQSTYSFEIPMPLEYFQDLAKALEKDNEIEANCMFLDHFDLEKMPSVWQALILPATHLRLARSYLNANRVPEANNHLKLAETEAELLISEHTSIRQDIYLMYGCVCIHVERFDLCISYLGQAEKIARMNLSRSSPCSLGCTFLLREVVEILQGTTELGHNLSLARMAFLRSENYIDVPKVAFILSYLCKVHNKCRHGSDSSVLTKMSQFLIEAFQVCRFDKILEGKSPENRYRVILNYIQELNRSSIKSTQPEQREIANVVGV